MESIEEKAKRLAKGFFLEGTNGCAVLVSHGFEGAPGEHALTAEALNKAGYSVMAPRLPGHGTTMEDLDKTPWQAWYKELEDDYLGLKKKYRKVFLVGLSMGSCLLIRVAEHYEVDGIAVMAPALYNKQKSSALAPLIAPFVKRLPLSGKNEFPGGVEKYLAGGYTKISVPAAVQLNRLERDTRKNLERIVSPILVLQSKADQMVSQKGAKMIMKLAQGEKKIVYFEKSGHIMSLDFDRNKAFSEIITFFDAHLK